MSTSIKFFFSLILFTLVLLVIANLTPLHADQTRAIKPPTQQSRPFPNLIKATVRVIILGMGGGIILWKVKKHSN